MCLCSAQAESHLCTWSAESIPPHVCVFARGGCGLTWRCGSRTGDEGFCAGLLEDIDTVLETKTLPFIISWLLGPNWKKHIICFYIAQQIIFVSKTLVILTLSIPRTGWLEYYAFCTIIYVYFASEIHSSIWSNFQICPTFPENPVWLGVVDC